MKENKQIELRSEKVRNIIGQIPSILITHGTMFIGLALISLFLAAAFIPYQPTIDTEVKAANEEPQSDVTTSASQRGREIGEANRAYGQQLSDPNLSRDERRAIIQEKKDYNRNNHR